MTILLENIGKRYNYEWIFRHLDYHFTNGNFYVITGPNGSGKSTLLQMLSGSLTVSEGKIYYHLNDFIIPAEKFFNYCSMAMPYLELIEEFTLFESMEFYNQFKPYITGVSIKEIIKKVGLEEAAHKQIRYFSSGMKQRVKLAQAIFAGTPLLLLDEPCTNLDAEGINMYHQLIKEYAGNRLVIISSNDPQEYDFCNQVINISNYK
jgi:heme exporter protein A